MKGAQLKRLLDLLLEAPSTSAECAALLRIPRRKIQIGIYQLARAGHVRAVGYASHPDGGPPAYRMQLKLYSAQGKTAQEGK